MCHAQPCKGYCLPVSLVLNLEVCLTFTEGIKHRVGTSTQLCLNPLQCLKYFIVVHQKNHHAIVELLSDSDEHIKVSEFCYNFPFAIESIKGLSEIHDEDTEVSVLFTFGKIPRWERHD